MTDPDLAGAVRWLQATWGWLVEVFSAWVLPSHLLLLKAKPFWERRQAQLTQYVWKGFKAQISKRGLEKEMKRVTSKQKSDIILTKLA